MGHIHVRQVHVINLDVHVHLHQYVKVGQLEQMEVHVDTMLVVIVLLICGLLQVVVLQVVLELVIVEVKVQDTVTLLKKASAMLMQNHVHIVQEDMQL